jgi:hypothetical protein
MRRATIVPSRDGATLGHVLHVPLKFVHEGELDDSPRGIKRAESRVVILYAGPIAERRFRKGRGSWRAGAGDDLDTAFTFLDHLAGPDRKHFELYQRLLWRRAELLVAIRWRDISAVAADLMRARTLDNEGVKAAIDRAYGFKPLNLRPL